MSSKKMSNMKAIVSITEISKMCQMSRSRFYQLLAIGFFPKPKYDDRSKRPYYDIELQHKCLECRSSGIGIDGSFMLFYSPRKSANVSDIRKKKIDPALKEIVETLLTMGLEVTGSQVGKAIQQLYPDGIGEIDQGLVIRGLFRYFKSD